MDRCLLVRRDEAFDVYLNGKKYGSGMWDAVYTAQFIYREAGYDVEIVHA